MEVLQTNIMSRGGGGGGSRTKHVFSQYKLSISHLHSGFSAPSHKFFVMTRIGLVRLTPPGSMTVCPHVL